MDSITLKIPNINCGHCIMTVKREGSMVPGAEFIDGNIQARTATFNIDSPEALNQLKVALADAGYPVEG